MAWCILNSGHLEGRRDVNSSAGPIDTLPTATPPPATPTAPPYLSMQVGAHLPFLLFSHGQGDADFVGWIPTIKIAFLFLPASLLPACMPYLLLTARGRDLLFSSALPPHSSLHFLAAARSAHYRRARVLRATPNGWAWTWLANILVPAHRALTALPYRSRTGSTLPCVLRGIFSHGAA